MDRPLHPHRQLGKPYPDSDLILFDTLRYLIHLDIYLDNDIPAPVPIVPRTSNKPLHTSASVYAGVTKSPSESGICLHLDPFQRQRRRISWPE